MPTKWQQTEEPCVYRDTDDDTHFKVVVNLGKRGYGQRARVSRSFTNSTLARAARLRDKLRADRNRLETRGDKQIRAERKRAAEHIWDANWRSWTPAEPTTVADLCQNITTHLAIFGRAPFVYYLRLGDGSIKIGTSTHVMARLGDHYDTLGPYEVLAVELGGYEVEQFRHRQFRAYRIEGERFQRKGTLLHFIATLRKAEPSSLKSGLRHT